ncbi:MAG: tryptophan synthase subunit alpha, partial [Candidatus Omnitrophota bacterium]
IIVPDLPMEEAGELGRAARKDDFCMILLAAPTTPAQRFKKIAAASSGFVYYVSLTGVTGARKTFSGETKNNVKKIKRLTSKPVCVGFGISRARQARDMARLSDGVIVGSAVVGIIEKNLSDKKKMVRDIERFARSVAGAVHAARV